MVIVKRYRVNGSDNMVEFLKRFYKFDKKLRFRLSKGNYDSPWDGWYNLISYYPPSYKDYVLNDNYKNLYYKPKKDEISYDWTRGWYTPSSPYDCTSWSSGD